MKKVIFVISVLVLFVSLLTLCTYAEAQSGAFGDNITVYINEDGTVIHFSGSGKMDDMPEGAQFDGFFTTVIIDEGITSLGNYVFNGMIDVEEIIIPSTVTEIGNYTFNDCRGLKKIVVPEGVISIGEGAFDGCDALEEIVLPESLESIGERCFAYAGSLRKIDLPDKIKQIPKEAFYRCSRLCEVTLPANLETIGEYAFQECAVLKAVTLPSSLRKIEQGAFQGCSELEEMRLNQGFEALGERAFCDCTNMKYLYIPSSVVEIGDHPLSYAGVLTVEYDGTKAQWKKISPHYWPGDGSDYEGNDWLCAPTCLQDSPSSCGALLSASGLGMIALIALAIPTVIKKRK